MGGWRVGFQFIQPFLKEKWRKVKGTDRIVYLRISDWTRTGAEEGGIWGHGTLTRFPGTHLILLRTACSKARFRTRIVYRNIMIPKEASSCITIIPHVLSPVSIFEIFFYFSSSRSRKRRGSRGKVCALKKKKIDNEMWNEEMRRKDKEEKKNSRHGPLSITILKVILASARQSRIAWLVNTATN